MNKQNRPKKKSFIVAGRLVTRDEQQEDDNPQKEQDMTDKKDEEVVFNQEKTGNTEKYSSTAGVRTPEQEESKKEAEGQEVEPLREEMKQKMSESTPANVKVDFGSVLNDPEQKAVRFGVVGSGHGGSRLAEHFHQFGYRVCVMNTAKQDLEYINLPEEQKQYLDFALGGVGKDLDLGETAAVENEQEIKALIERMFGKDAEEVDQFVLCIGGGGGTGSGSAVPLVKLLTEYGIPITILYTLPMTNEGTVTKWNAVTTLDKLSKLAINNLISGLVVIDNSRIEEIYSGVSLGNFYKVANFDIANIFNSFNTMSSLPTNYMAIDPMDFARILSSGNCIIYGKVELPLHAEEGFIELEEDDIAAALVHNVQHNMLAEGFNLEDAMRAGVYVTGKSEYLNQISASTFNYAFASLNDMLDKADLFKGVYPDERLDDKLIIYIVVSGLGLPRDRVEALKSQAQEDLEEMEAKETNKQAKMSVFEEVQSHERDKYRQQKKRNSTFGKIARRRRSRN